MKNSRRIVTEQKSYPRPLKHLRMNSLFTYIVCTTWTTGTSVSRESFSPRGTVTSVSARLTIVATPFQSLMKSMQVLGSDFEDDKRSRQQTQADGDQPRFTSLPEPRRKHAATFAPFTDALVYPDLTMSSNAAAPQH
jgi:hypothetical protein